MSPAYEYYIIEHPTLGVLKDLEETDSGNVGRFSPDGLRGDERCMRFHSGQEANRARGQITPARKRLGCQIRAYRPYRGPGIGVPHGHDYWPVVA